MSAARLVPIHFRSHRLGWVRTLFPLALFVGSTMAGCGYFESEMPPPVEIEQITDKAQAELDESGFAGLDEAQGEIMPEDLSRLNQLLCWQPTPPKPGEKARLFIERSHPVYGVLRVQVTDEYSSSALRNATPPVMLEEDLPETELALAEILAAKDPTQAYRSALALSERFPFWPKVHGALSDYALARGDFQAAVFHVQQLVATDTNFSNVHRLGRIYGQMGQVGDAAIILSYLYEHRGEQAADPTQAMTLVGDLLVTLHRANQPEKMVRIADEAISEYGPVSSFEYQAILGLHLSNQKTKAQERMRRVLAGISSQDPLMPRFQQLNSVLEQ